MKNIKWFGLAILAISLLVGGLGQTIAFAGSDFNWLIRPAMYNGYFQIALGIIAGYVVIRHIDRSATAKYEKPITNARDKR